VLKCSGKFFPWPPRIKLLDIEQKIIVVVVVVASVSHSFGYGLMDAYAMVKLARNWKTVPEQHKCEVSAPHTDK
jgi:hypothetical protein